MKWHNQRTNGNQFSVWETSFRISLIIDLLISWTQTPHIYTGGFSHTKMLFELFKTLSLFDCNDWPIQSNCNKIDKFIEKLSDAKVCTSKRKNINKCHVGIKVLTVWIIIFDRIASSLWNYYNSTVEQSNNLHGIRKCFKLHQTRKFEFFFSSAAVISFSFFEGKKFPVKISRWFMY